MTILFAIFIAVILLLLIGGASFWLTTLRTDESFRKDRPDASESNASAADGGGD
jgi:CHASE3 domain sensor protein